jgi:hypothetical protein
MTSNLAQNRVFDDKFKDKVGSRLKWVNTHFEVFLCPCDCLPCSRARNPHSRRHCVDRFPNNCRIFSVNFDGAVSFEGYCSRLKVSLERGSSP